MRIIIPLVLGLALLALLIRHFLKTPPADLARQLYMTGGVALMAIGVGLLFVRQFVIALPVGMAGLMLFRRHRAMRPLAGSGQTSSVRAAGIEMSLDHDTGAMDGQVLAGRYEGRRLSELDQGSLLEVAEDMRDDAESLRLLESYLDRAHPGWRGDAEADESTRQRATPAAGGMDTKEAYQILGLEPGAGEHEVRDAHRRLMKQVHPDRGGSAALAAKINEAKDRILGKHR
jgi:DnaJ-like protein